MKFKLEIATDNQAFSDHPHFEVARILKKLSEKVESDGVESYILADINGNAVGKAIWS